MTLPAAGPHFSRFEDYARWASDEIAQTMLNRSLAADAEREIIDAHCDWEDDEDGTYHTHCKNAFVFIDGGFAENGFLFCPFCGGRVTHHIHETGTDE